MGVEVIHLTVPPHVFSDLIKFGACYIMCQWGQVQNEIKDVIIYFQKLFLLFFIIICFYHDVLSKIGLFYEKKMSVRLYGYEHIMGSKNSTPINKH